ncbi:MAG: 1-(5-phosphoribosyl)-5-[(5-phosphoribosylamino)methylideneamino]imidazole-4-carboxamide isomerase [Chloroflexi bacterium]|nr:1-(5-phosphoribosyl)-5-[(5-phosphoribosylamino)methylideneamino]imidazole-4-carboxamide isomerase [Chloroflexota bacterium]
MIIFPAIDLRHGRVVRLQQGRADAETVYDDDPLRVARHWADSGADWLHLVNLDGALGDPHHRAGRPSALDVLAQILEKVAVRVQFGGGIRSLEDIAYVLGLGADRVVLGTLAVEQPDVVREAMMRFGAGRIVVGLDARDGQVVTHGWVTVADVDVVTLGRAMRKAGVVRALYTDVSRDGMLTGVNVAATAHLARETGLQVIASGGVATLDDISRLKAVEPQGVEGVVIGQALYRRAFTLRQALDAALTG